MKIIAFVDKSFPPEHSFIDGVLGSKEINTRSRVLIFCARKKNEKDKFITRYKRAIAFAYLSSLPRGFFRRILSFFHVYFIIKFMSFRYKKEKLSFYVRNDPFLLLAAACATPKKSKIIYHLSFPFYKFNRGAIYKFIYKNIIKLAIGKVSQVITVSELAKQRFVNDFLSKSESNVKLDVVPLFSEMFPLNEPSNPKHSRGCKRELTFVYVGTHDERRRLNLVLNAIVKFIREDGGQGKFLFYGSSYSQRQELYRSVVGLNEVVSEGIVDFVGKVERKFVPAILSRCDVGLSLIPPTEIYQESSPTKVCEYLSQGLYVLASKGIPSQERLIEDSQLGFLSNFDEVSIRKSLARITMKNDEIVAGKSSRCRFYLENLVYSSNKYVFDIFK